MTLQFTTELFPQLDSTSTESYYYQNSQEQLAYYFYQRANNPILESDTLLYPISYPSYTTQQPCNIIQQEQQHQHQQPLIISPISHAASPLSIETENYPLNHNPQQPYYTYDNVMDMNIMTPPTTIYDSNLMSPPAVIHDFPPVTAYEQPTHSNLTSNRRASISSLSSLSSNSSNPNKCYITKTKQNSTVLFHCEYEGCTKTFTRTYNLKSHRRTHTDEKPFVCHFCPKAFARQHDRNRHEKLHLGLKPYPCEYCSKSFARLDALNRHLKRDKKSTKGNTNEESPPPPCLLLKLKKANSCAKKKKLNCSA